VAEIAAPATTVFGILSLDLPSGLVHPMPESSEGGRLAAIEIPGSSRWRSTELVIADPPFSITYRMIQGPCAKLERIFHVRERSGGQSRVLVESNWTPGGVFGRLSGHKAVTQATRALLQSVQEQAERMTRLRLVGTQEHHYDALADTATDRATLQHRLLLAVEEQELLEWGATGHGHATARYAGYLAGALRLPDNIRRAANLAGALHDVGKTKIEPHLFNRELTLSATGQRRLEQHPQLGAALVVQLPPGEILVPAIRHHHERWDGEGYPDGLRGSSIPLAARIIAVAEAADAMQRPLPERRARSAAEVAGILERHAGRQWDPELAHLLAGMLVQHQDPVHSGGRE
jgi:response regulator RpfG family c-di-GMP phosphodiesterase